jgi:hypothetical protein
MKGALRRREATPFRGRAGFAGTAVGKNSLRNTTDIDPSREVALRRREATPFRGRAGFAGTAVGKNRLRNTTDTIRLARWR